MPYDIGNPVRMRVTITNTDTGALLDPATLVATAYGPGGIMITPSTTRDSLGVWECIFTPTVGGRWVVAFTGTSPACVGQRAISVNPVPSP